MANANATACLKPMAAASNGVFQQDNPMDFALPLLIVQICLILAVTRLLAILLKPLRQPRVIAEIIGGILLGPSGLGHSVTYINYIFPKKSLTVLDTVAGLGLMFFLFFVGLELDLHAIKRTGRQALSIAAAGISVPFVAGVGVSLVLHRTIATDGNFAPFMVFMGVAMSITAFPVLARILAERKLLTTDVGQMAMSAAAVNDVVAWILLALAVALSGSGKSPLIALWVLLCGAGFVIVMFTVVKPMMAYIVKQTEENEPVNELHIGLTLAGVLAAGFVTDAIGIHSIFGAFLFGLIIPKEGPFARVLVEKIEDLVTTLMLPLYFASSGLKTNIASIHGWQSIGFLVLVVSTACIGKIFGTFIVASLHKMNVKKSLTLGFLMNTKGLVELIVLNIGKDRKVLNDETFAIMVLMALFTTFITTPVVMALYKPARNRVPYRRRTIYVSGDNPDTELRVLACVHGMPNVVATLNLVEASRGTRKRPLHMYILHLLQLTERPSSIIKVQQVRENGLPSSEYHNNMDSVVLAFDTYGQLSKVTVQVLTAISNFNDMHEDICAIAGERRASIIIIPFHKHARRTDGVWEGYNLGLRSVNHKVLLHAPCSVGILVDRGLGIASLSSSHVDHNVAVLFFGGGDDREALAFGCRMAEHPGIKLTVFSFVHKRSKEDVPIDVVANGKGQAEIDLHSRSITRSSRFSMVQETYDFMVTLGLDTAEEFKQDKECMASLASSTSPSIVHEIREVSNPLEAAIEIGKLPTFSLLLVGRGRRPSSMIAPLSGTPAQLSELGPVGDALVSHSLNTHSSLLVVQQYDPSLVKEELLFSKADVSVSKSQSCGFNSFLVATGPRDDSTSKESAHRLPV